MSGRLVWDDDEPDEAFPWWAFYTWVGLIEVDGIASAPDLFAIDGPMIYLKDDNGGAAARLRWDRPPDEDELAAWCAGRFHLESGVPGPACERRPW
jgi:hypothetical protein